VTQSNSALRDALALAAHVNVSTMSTVSAAALLRSSELPSILQLNSERLATNYNQLTSFFRQCDIEYLPCNAGFFVMARLVPFAKTWDDEAELVQKLSENGVLVGGGRGYHVHEPGWARVSFGVQTEVLDKAIKRMKKVFQTVKNE